MMIGRRACRLIAGLAVLAVMMAAVAITRAETSGPHRVGLVILHGDGQVLKRCVEFSEDTITGLELLQRAGLDLNVDASSSVGATVCRIDSEGCTFPGESCFCQCEGSSCVYWSYWHLAAGAGWRYSNTGPAARLLSDGESDGWVWGEGNSSDASAALPANFDEICTPATATPTATATEPPATNSEPPSRDTDTPDPHEDTTSAPAATDTSMPAVTPLAAPSGTPVSAAQAPVPSATNAEPVASSTPWKETGTAVVTVPTIISAAPETAAEITPDQDGLAPGSPEPRATPVPSPALAVRAAPSATAQPTRRGPTPTPMLASDPIATPPLPARATTSPAPGLLLAAGISLAAAAASGAALLVLRRP